jgi:membrane associated rhomboid family serine protease
VTIRGCAPWLPLSRFLPDVCRASVTDCNSSSSPSTLPLFTLAAHTFPPQHNWTEARRNIFFVPTNLLTIGSLSVIHPEAASFRRSAAAPECAVADQQDTAKYQHHSDPCYTFVPLLHQNHGHLGRQFMTLITHLVEVATASGKGGFTLAQIVAGFLHELCVCICRWGYVLDCTGAGFFT